MSGISLSLDMSRLIRAQGHEVPQESPGEAPQERELLIIGGGPAGLSAGIYAGRAQLRPLVIVGQAFGGQAATTSEMENYPGFPDGIGGMALAEQIANQAKRFGAEIAFDEVISVDLRTYPLIIVTHGATYRAKALIVATGTSARKLRVPGEAKFIGRGVSFCATCDGFFYREKRVVVVKSILGP